MAMLIRTYDGHDVVIPSAAIEELGVKPGDKIIVRPDIILKVSHLSATEKERRLRVLSALYGAWSAEDEIAFNRDRRRMGTAP